MGARIPPDARAEALPLELGGRGSGGGEGLYAGGMAGKKRAKKKEPLEFRNTALGDALQTQDMAAVAFALRHGPTVVPLMKAGDRDKPLDVGEVWTYRDPNSGDIALLLFSDAKHKPAA